MLAIKRELEFVQAAGKDITRLTERVFTFYSGEGARPGGKNYITFQFTNIYIAFWNTVPDHMNKHKAGNLTQSVTQHRHSDVCVQQQLWAQSTQTMILLSKWESM